MARGPRFLCAVLVASSTLALLSTPAQAVDVTQFAWDRTGAEHLPCAGSVDWSLSPGHGIVNATVGIDPADGIPNGHGWGMLQTFDADESWYIISTEPVALTDDVAVAYIGTAEAQPTLTLVSCTPAEAPVVPPPVIPPTQEPAPAPAPAPALTWNIGFKVTTIRRTNVSAHYHLTCSAGGVSVPVKGRVKGMTPMVRHLAPSIDGATTCSLVVRAWDIPPHVRPHSWPAPVVTTWANPS